MKFIKEFEGKVAVITGAASGIGLGIAKRAIKEGMKVIIADIEEEALSSAEDLLKKIGDHVLAVPTDVSKVDNIEKLAHETLDIFGKIHFLYNNAGVGSGGVIWEIPLKEWEWVLNVNLWGVIYGIRTFVPIMLQQDEECHIVNTSSLSGLISTVYQGAYTVAKYGVVALSEVLMKELSAMNSKIKVSVFCPGFVKTNIINSRRNCPEDMPYRAMNNDIVREFFLQLHPEATEYMTQYMERWENGISPDKAGDIVFEALKDDVFYILTDTALYFKNMVKERANGILESFE